MRRFSIQKHDATTLHYDLRLEYGDVLKSWAVPKGVPKKQGPKNLAIRTEDHNLEYIDFEGEIEEGKYGAGTVEVWDKGKYELSEFGEEKVKFYLDGEKVQGNYVLIKLDDGEDNYLLMRVSDDAF